MQLIEPATVSSLETDVASSLWNSLVLDQLQESLYNSRLAGLDYSLSHTGAGTEIAVSGFSDKLGLLLTKVLDAVLAPEEFGARFKIVRDAMLRDFENAEQVRISNNFIVF